MVPLLTCKAQTGIELRNLHPGHTTTLSLCDAIIPCHLNKSYYYPRDSCLAQMNYGINQIDILRLQRYFLNDISSKFAQSDQRSNMIFL